MVSSICYKISTTVCYCPYIQWMQIGPFCYRIGYINIKGNTDKKVLNGRPYCVNWSVWPIPADTGHYDQSLLTSLMKRNSVDRRYDPSYLTRKNTLHHHKYRQRGGNLTIDSKTHPSRQWTLQPIIIDVRHEAEFRQKTSYLTSEVTTHPHRYPSRGRIRAIDSEDPSWPSMDIMTHQLLAIRPSILFWGVL